MIRIAIAILAAVSLGGCHAILGIDDVTVDPRLAADGGVPVDGGDNVMQSRCDDELCVRGGIRELGPSARPSVLSNSRLAHHRPMCAGSVCVTGGIHR